MLDGLLNVHPVFWKVLLSCYACRSRIVGTLLLGIRIVILVVGMIQLLYSLLSFSDFGSYVIVTPFDGVVYFVFSRSPGVHVSHVVGVYMYLHCLHIVFIILMGLLGQSLVHSMLSKFRVFRLLRGLLYLSSIVRLILLALFYRVRGVRLVLGRDRDWETH